MNRTVAERGTLVLIGLGWVANLILARTLETYPALLRFLGSGVRGGVLLVLLFLLLAGVWTREAWWSRKAGFRLTAAGLAFLLAVGVGEVAARVVHPPPRFHAQIPAPPNVHVEFRDLELPGVSPSMRFTTNAWGMRGDPAPKEWEEHATILTIGGSTTQCGYLDDTRTWPALVQAGLKAEGRAKVWVGNAGFNGHSTRGHLLVMKHMVPVIRPDVLVFLVGMNDLALSMRRSSLEKGNGYDEARGAPRGLLISRSRLYQLAAQWWQVNVEGVQVERGAAHNPVDLKTARRSGGVSPLPADIREALPSLPEYRRNLLWIIKLGRKTGARMLFLTQPLLFGPGHPWDAIDAGEMDGLDAQPWRISGATLWRMLDVFNRELITVCREQKVACYDLASKIPHSSEMFYDHCHFTEIGARLVAKHVSRALSGILGAR